MPTSEQRRQLAAVQPGRSGGDLYRAVKENLAPVSGGRHTPPPPRPAPLGPSPFARSLVAQKGQLRQLTTQQHTPPTRWPLPLRNPVTGREPEQAVKLLQQEQRYTFSPFAHAKTLYVGTKGDSVDAIREGNLPPRPVFLNEKTAMQFHQQTRRELKALNSQTDPLSAEQQLEKRALMQMQQWSGKGSALYEFPEAKRSHPVVHVYGHGSPGGQYIQADDSSKQRKHFSTLAIMLKSKKMPTVSEVRANSCWSGTQHDLGKRSPEEVKRSFVRQTSSLMAGDWSKTFAGRLQHSLKSEHGFRSRVIGYLGKIMKKTQDDAHTLHSGMRLDRQKSMTVSTVHTGETQMFKRSQMSRKEGV